ncbi:hypothetical protein [Anatilimnocola floriformis]|uniref:hypothetical protein n=1 Tax=Anatilimnocola floriformis TaxID=2948575 RepID=UPI0020C31E61|nr:hypothetical protein [Anatilimnocola floriformis]
MPSNRRKSTPAISACGHLVRVVRVLLILWAAWHGPLPWCHSHGTLGNTTAGDQGFLRAHLLSHHGSVDPCCSVCFGWHFHIDFPPGENDSEGARSTLSLRHLTSGLQEANLTALVKSAADATDCNACMSVVAPTFAQPTVCDPVEHFFDGFAPSLAMPLRFGVIRC